MPEGRPATVDRQPVTAFVAIGANLGDAQAAVRQAIQALDHLPQSRVERHSSLYRTAPFAVSATGVDAGPDYINAVVAISTALPAPDLLRQLQSVENAAGRTRSYRNAPRTLDLDLLLYGTGRIDSATLTVPHPRMMQRAFVLVPLEEIAPELISAAQLAAVANQLIERLGPVDDERIPPTMG